MTPYSNIYNPLDTEKSQIRLVTIHPKDQESQQIRCDLEICSLDEKPHYEALSYVWGDQSHPLEILLDGQVFLVGLNLASALGNLRLADRPRRLWIDAICINQGDQEERSSQVLLMRQIYSYASRVVVWLGIDTPENVSALNLLRSVKEMIHVNESVDGGETPSQSDIAKVRNYLDTDMSTKESHSFLFRDFLMQPWWGRVWVTQEVAVSSRATVVIGESELEWSSVFNAIETIAKSGAVPSQVGSPLYRKGLSSMNSVWNIVELRRTVKQGFIPSISTLIAANRQAATDPRDHVYALLGLAKENDNPLLRPNYLDSNPASAVFLFLIEYSVRVENSLDIICLSQGRIRNDLPSWCPDWTQPPRLGWNFSSDLSDFAPFPLIPTYISLLSNNLWHACGSKSAAARIIRSPPTLACKGLVVDVVEVIGEPIVMGHLFVWNRHLINLHPWETLLLNHFEGLKSKATQSANGQSIFDVSDQYHRLVASLAETPNFAPRASVSLAMILRSQNALSKLTYSSYRCLQKLRRKTRPLFQGFHFQYITGGPLAEAYVRTLSTNRLSNGMTIIHESHYKLFWSKVPKWLNDPATTSTAQFQKSLVENMMLSTCARTLVLTKKGYLGLGPTNAQQGDLVCILYGCSVPVIIRKYGQHYRFVGESYIHGLMDGAAVDQPSLRDTMEEREFVLR
ncbi:hypothetical protein JMJ35_002765 [Cladonia borealis]|uniref:Heterokaryon incompatibility domain-containing protein n=1 Tax=Cladonia borealis TaxID=184061 RepID=A0AA39R783_9LECA|nr:hypothetical protein JMJ35_002765 [Cladonia borealis]